MPATMAFHLHKKSMFLVMHAKDNPSDQEWNEYVEFAKKNVQYLRTTLIITEGGGPSTVQRGELNDVLEKAGFKSKIAVVTLSRMVRGIVTAISWFNPNIKAFSTIQVPAALEYLEIPVAERDVIFREIKTLRIKLGLPPEPAAS